MGEVSQKQLEANRENAKLGGVKTEGGKAVSKYNAIKHGLLSEKVLMDNENKAELEELGKKLRADLKPQSEIEVLLVDRIIANFWRLGRVMEIEQQDVLSVTGGLKYRPDNVFRYEVMVEKGIYKALHELQRFQAARMGEKPPAPIAIDFTDDREKYQ